MLIEVTEEDIRRGIVNDCHVCPVAIALGRALGVTHGNGGAISVRHDYICAWKDTPRNAMDTPQAVAYFIHDFDVGLAVRPFTFDLPDLSGMEAAQ